MTREEAKQAVEVLKAFADGKKIEFCNKVGVDYWKVNDNADYINFNFCRYNYRVAKEPQYRPFESGSECWDELFNHKPFAKIIRKDSGERFNILRDNIIDEILKLNGAFIKFTFADGEPFGIKIE